MGISYEEGLDAFRKAEIERKSEMHYLKILDS